MFVFVCLIIYLFSGSVLAAKNPSSDNEGHVYDILAELCFCQCNVFVAFIYLEKDKSNAVFFLMFFL